MSRHAAPRGLDLPATQPMPMAAVTPVHPRPAPEATYLPGTSIRTDHSAPALPLVGELTAALTAYAADARLARAEDLMPFLAKTLVCHGWVTDGPGR